MGSLSIIKEPRNPKYSLLLPISRPRLLDLWLENLRQNAPKVYDQTELIIYLDSDNQEFGRTLFDYFMGQRHWNGIKLYQSGFDGDSNYFSLNWRRDQICRMLNKAKSLLSNTQFLMGMEDDTTLDPHTLQKLLDKVESDSSIGFVEAVQMGRHNVPMIGAWEVDDINNPSYITTCAFNPTRMKEIDGGGLYAYATKTYLFKRHEFHWHDECFGPDVEYVLSIRRQGLKAYCDMSLKARHHTPDGVLDPFTQQVEQVSWQKRKGKWERSNAFPLGPPKTAIMSA